MSLGLSNYSSLNGLGLITGGTSGYGYGLGYGGFASDTYADYAKKAISNNYDVTTTNQSYTNKQGVEENAFVISCQSIQDMLKDGRTDDAIQSFNNMVGEMSTLSQYQGYSEKELKGLAQKKYAAATQSTLLGDVAQYSDSSFMSGLKNSNPISIFLCQSSSKADAKADITTEPSSNVSKAAKVAGAATGGIAFTAGAVALKSAHKAWKNTAGSKKFTEHLSKTVSKLWKNVKKTNSKTVKTIAIAGAVIGVVCLGAKALINKLTGTTQSEYQKV